MLTKEHIENLKKESNGGFAHLTEKYKDAKNLSFILENLGYLPDKFDGSFLFDLLNHENPKVRLLSAKNIAKLNDVENLGKLWDAFKNETDTATKRELVSAIGRLRNARNKPFLFEILQDEDPKVVCQAIRGLLNYENDVQVERRLKPLLDHQNETVRTVIYKEFFAEKTKKESALPHPETYNYLKNVVVNADVLDALKCVPDESIHLTFTSPPYYNARDYLICLML